MSRQPDMGHTRAHRFPTPSKIQFTEHNGRIIVANPSGVPAKWMHVYAEYAARMYSDEPISFNIGKDTASAPVIGRAEIQDAWYTFTTPAEMLAAIGVAQTAPPSPAKKETETMPKIETEVIRPGSGVPPYLAIAPAPIVPLADEIDAFMATHEAPTLPQWAEEWLGQLVYATKRDYARQYLEHLLCGADAPADPGADWADKARKRADRLAKQAA